MGDLSQADEKVDTTYKLGFWNRLTAAVTAASLVYVPSLYILFVIPQLLVSGGNPATFASSATGAISGSVVIIILAVFLVGYPVESFLVREADSPLRAATRHLVTVVLILLAYLVVQLFLNRLSGENFLGFLAQLWIVGYVAVAAGITSFGGRLLYSVLVKFKRTMYLSGSGLGAIAISPAVVHFLLGLQLAH